jgi:hypothetical protein
MSYSISTPLGELLDNEQTNAVLETHLPGISNFPGITMGRGYPLETVASFSGGKITPEHLSKIDVDLKALG